MTTSLEVEVSKVSLGAWELWENEAIGTSLGETGTTEEIVQVPLGDGAVEVSLEVSVAGAFLEVGTVVTSLVATAVGAIGALSGNVQTGALLAGKILTGGPGEREAPVGAVEAPPGDGAFLEIGVTVVTVELHLRDWVVEFSLGAVVAGAFCKEEAISGSEVVTASREGSARNSLGGEVLGAFLDDGVFGLFEGEGGIIAGAALGDRAAGASLRATGIALFLQEEGFLIGGTAGVIGASLRETVISSASAGMALGAVGAEAFCRVGGFSHGAVVTPSGDTTGVSLSPAVLRAFWGKGTVSSGAVMTPSEDGSVSLGAAVLRDLLGDGIAEFSLGAAVFEVFLGERVISSGTAVTPSEDSFAGVSLGPAILGAFLGAEGIFSGSATTPSGDGTVGASLGPDILGTFLGEGVSSDPTETPLEGWAGISLGVDVLEVLWEADVSEVSLGVAVFEVFWGERGISSGTAVTLSGVGVAGISLGAAVLGAFLGEAGQIGRAHV